jgi:hypothetical protein
MEKKLSIKERAALLMSLMSNSSSMQVPDKTAKEALKILKSLQENTSTLDNKGRTSLKNPVTKTEVGMTNYGSGRGGGNNIDFSRNGSFARPAQVNTPTQQLGVQATINQLLSEIPIKGAGDSRYEASPVTDSKDFAKRLDGYKGENQRAKAYRRMTKGAFTLPPDNTMMRGNRLGESKWQPRGEKSRYAKAVNYDLTEVLKRLGIKGAQRTAVRMIPGIGQALSAYMTGEDMFKAVTGKSPTGESIKFADQSIKDQSMPRPATLMMPRR